MQLQHSFLMLLKNCILSFFFLTIKCPLLLSLTEILARIQALEADSEHFLNCQFGYLTAESCRYL